MMDLLWTGGLALVALYVCGAGVCAMMESDTWYSYTTGFLLFCGFICSAVILFGAVLAAIGVL